MLFRSAAANQKYVVTPVVQQRDQYARVIQTVPGIRVEFKGKPGSEGKFDSEAHGWDDETRLRVERYLLSHHEFRTFRWIPLVGTMEYQPQPIRFPVLDLDRGQEIPDEHKEFVKGLAWYKRELTGDPDPEIEPGERKQLCAYRVPMDDDMVAECQNEPVKGDFYCAKHLAELEEAQAVNA